MHSTYTIYTRKEYMKFAGSVLTLRLKKALPLLYFLFSLVLFFVHGDISLVGVLYSLILCFLTLLVSSIFVVPLCFAVSRRNWNTDKSIHNLRFDMTFGENDLKISSANAQVSVKYEDVHKVIETKTHFYIMVSSARGYIVVKDNCSKELIDFIRNLKK